MQCLKCGKPISDGQSFCEACLEVMAKYPVKPGTPVQILPRTDKDKVARKRELPAEELLAKQKKKNRRLRRTVLVLSLVLLCALGALVYFLLPYLKNLPLPTPPM